MDKASQIYDSDVEGDPGQLPLLLPLNEFRQFLYYSVADLSGFMNIVCLWVDGATCYKQLTIVNCHYPLVDEKTMQELEDSLWANEHEITELEASGKTREDAMKEYSQKYSSDRKLHEPRIVIDEKEEFSSRKFVRCLNSLRKNKVVENPDRYTSTNSDRRLLVRDGDFRLDLRLNLVQYYSKKFVRICRKLNKLAQVND